MTIALWRHPIDPGDKNAENLLPGSASGTAYTVCSIEADVDHGSGSAYMY